MPFQRSHSPKFFLSALLSVAVIASTTLPAQALIKFQDDTFHDIDSEGIIIDSDNAGPGVDIDIIADQGNDNDGTLRYNATSNVWELSNDGGAFEEIATITSTDLDDAYNNVGAAASAITVDAAESQTGGIAFIGSLAGDETFTVSNSGAGGAMLVENTGAGNSFQVNDVAADTTPFVIDATGEVGIGTATPVRPLQISRTGANFGLEYANLDIQTTGATGFGPSVTLDATAQTGGSEYYLVSTAPSDVSGAGNFLIFDFGAFASRLVIDSAGDVGLGGETAPGHLLDITGTGEVIEIGSATAADLIVNFNDDDGDQNFGWDDSEEAFSTFDEELILRVDQSATPPVTCAASVAGRLWHDTDTGITYVCDTSNSRDKWLSIGEFTLTGGESATCAAGASTGDGCIMDIHNGTDANDLGWQVPRDATIVGGSFHSDASCTDGTGVDLEIQTGDNGGLAAIGDILTGCTDANGCSATGLNIDITADDVIRTVLDNNCTTGSVTDWSSIILLRWRQ